MKAFIFDFDGTLADTLPVCVESFRRALEHHTGRRYTDAQITAHFGLNEEGILKRMAPDCWGACLETFLHQYELQHEALQPFPGVAPMLEQLRASGFRLGMVTGKGEGSGAISLRHFGLESFFDVMEFGSAERNAKDEGIRKVLRDLEVAPDEAAYVGDSPSDVASAREAGVFPIAAAWMPGADLPGLRAQNPPLLFSHLEEFCRWIRNRGWIALTPAK